MSCLRKIPLGVTVELATSMDLLGVSLDSENVYAEKCSTTLKCFLRFDWA